MKERDVEYYANKYRVFEIYGISRNESRKYSMHHIWFASDGPISFYPDPICQEKKKKVIDWYKVLVGVDKI